jgi:hypothetical protein
MNDTPVGFKLSGLRARYRFALLAFLTNEAAFIFLSIYVSELFLVPAFVVLFVFGFYAIRLKCPVCGKPVLYNRVNNLGIEMYVYTPAMPSHCSKCGARLV